MTFRSSASLTLAAIAWIALAALACLPTQGKAEEGAAAARDLRPVTLQREIRGVQPMTGIVFWDTSPHRRSQAIQLEFSYIGYGQLVDEDGAYDWSLVEDKLAAIAERGHQAIFRYYTPHDQRQALAPEGPHGESFEEAARRFGISYLIGDGQPEYQTMERIRDAGMACGYRFRVISFESAPGRSRVGVRNEGIAPIYHDAFVAVDGVRAGESLRRLAPGEESVFEIAVGGAAPSLTIESDRLVPGQRIEYVASLVAPEHARAEADAPAGAVEGDGEAPPSATPQPAKGEAASSRQGGEASIVGETPLDRAEPEAGTNDTGVVASVFQLVGGIGLFLMGMVLLTEGIKAYAGESLRFALMRFTGTPVKSFASGALVTTLVQSSSATTVTVIGFVSAGLLAFPQAIGVILGASLGTTATGWVVAGLGLKVSVGLYALPLVGIGAFLRLLARGRAKALGTFLAGFGLIFIGIDFMQLGMRSLGEGPALSSLPSEGLNAHLLAMLVGIVLTVAMQSSSAAVATTLTALHTGAVNFEQAASVVIGAAVGTTVTGVIAAIGGTVPAKRTALAHVVFNLATGVIAVLLLPLLLWVVGLGQRHLGLDGGAMSLAAFHTIFIALGVALFLPFVDRFARVIERLLPDRGPALTRHLDRTVLRAPSVALEASRRALVLVSLGTFRILRNSLGFESEPRPGGDQPGPDQLREALERIRAFLPQIPAASGDEPVSDERLAQLHSIDHLERLLSKLSPPKLEAAAQKDPGETLRNGAQMANTVLELGIEGLGNGIGDPGADETASGSEAFEVGGDWFAALESKAYDLAELRRLSRPHILREASLRGMDPAVALDQLDLLRWYDRIAFHAWRVCHHLGRGGTRSVEPPEEDAAAGLGAEVFDDDGLPD